MWDASIRYGPVDDGRPVGAAFDAALDRLNTAIHEAVYNPDSGYRPTLTIRICCVRTPGGRGRNAVHWEGTTAGWNQSVRGATEEVVIGKLLVNHLRSGEPPPRVSYEYVAEKDGP